MTPSRFLTLASHEGWIAQLDRLATPFDLADGLPGRYTAQWDERMRPFPKFARRVRLDDADVRSARYDFILAHSLTDLMAVDAFGAPKILVLHTSPEHRARQEGRDGVPPGFLEAAAAYVAQARATVIAISPFKGASWRLPHTVVASGVDANEPVPWTGEIASGLRVANQIIAKRDTLLYGLHEAAFCNVPIRIVGHNPGIAGAEPARDYDHLRLLLSQHRFMAHTADPRYEDGFNLAVLEGMAAGLPILGNRHPTSPAEHGVSGFLSDDPQELHQYAMMLTADRELARRMGAAARRRVLELFPASAFVRGLREAAARAAEMHRGCASAGIRG